ncbi:MAG: calcium/sodium antiporter [Candidatus Omnitrophica bacterium]|nr:calcium/sodium antiporter [Candidatus Omnitrophota bacterium]
MYNIALLLIGFFILIKSAGLLVTGSSSLAKRFKVSELVIGLTVVAFGTSLPELSVNIIASIRGNADIAIGNVLGSNIANILFILGASAIIFPLSVTKSTVLKGIPLSLLAVLLLGIMANDAVIDKSGFSGLTMIDGLVLIAFFIVFLYYAVGISDENTELNSTISLKESHPVKIVLFILIGLFGLWIGSKWVVEGALYIASVLSLSNSFVGLTIVALGTSLPELATSVVAAFNKKPEIAVGNIVGSNIFNVFFILGVSSMISPLPFSRFLNADIGMAILSSLLLFVCMFTGKRHKIDRWEGFVFLAIYLCYITFLLFRG